jgi:hypothetical protein
VTDPRPHLKITGATERTLDVEDALGNLVQQLALAARQHQVMISLTVTPFEDPTLDRSNDDDDDTPGYRHA